MSVKELNDKFDQWNPMENDYKNTEFNHYISGPGAEMDDELQPGQQALQSSKCITIKREAKPVPSLIFQNVPKEMTVNAIRNICSTYGRVTDVRDSSKNTYHFVDMATVADMEAVLRALERNCYGIKVFVSKKQKPSDIEKHQYQTVSTVLPRTTGIDYQSRNFRTSNKNHPRPKVNEDKLLSASDASINGLPINLIANDAHSLERQGLYKMKNNDKFNYRNGRSYVTMPEKTKQFIEKKHKESSGTYSEVEKKYIHTMENSATTNYIRKCSQCFYACDTVCGRCSQYYCSVECQLNDWPEHRYKCGKPKHLQKTPPSSQASPTSHKSHKLSKENYNISSDNTTATALEMKTIKITSPEEPVKPTNGSPQQLATSQKTSYEKLANASKSSVQNQSSSLNPTKQHRSSSKESPEELLISLKTSQQLPNFSKPKKIPAALKTSVKQLVNSSKESPIPLQGSSKIITQELPKSSPDSQNNSNKASENIEKIYKQNMPRSGNIVTITAISKTNVVFIRSTTFDDNVSYFNTVDGLQIYGKMAQPLKNLPKSGEVVIAKFQDQFNRALVLNASNPTKILIHFMDYGNMEQAKMEDLFEAPKEFVYKPRHAIPVLLKDVTDFYMTQEIRKFMHSYLNSINVEIRYKPEDFRKDNNVYAVELIDETTQLNFNKMIIKLSKPVEPKNINEICDRDYLDKKELPRGNNIELFVMDNSLMCSGCISCTIKPYAIEINKFKKEIQAYVESIPKEAYTPRAEELCIARYSEDGLWYRGLCLETVGDGHPSIHFIDYGNITIVPIENIRRYPRQFTFPIYTFDCAIEGLPELCDDKLVAKLEDLIPNGELINCENVTVVDDSNFYLLSLPNVIKELTKCGLIKNSEHVM